MSKPSWPGTTPGRSSPNGFGNFSPIAFNLSGVSAADKPPDNKACSTLTSLPKATSVSALPVAVVIPLPISVVAKFCTGSGRKLAVPSEPTPCPTAPASNASRTLTSCP